MEIGDRNMFTCAAHQCMRMLVCPCNSFSLSFLRQKRRQWFQPPRVGKDLKKFPPTKTQSHLPGADWGLCYCTLHGVPQRTGCNCTRALHLILHSCGRVIVSQQACIKSPVQLTEIIEEPLLIFVSFFGEHLVKKLWIQWFFFYTNIFKYI